MIRVQQKRKKSKIKIILITIIVMLCALLSIFPFYWMILNSFKNPNLINQGSVKIFTFDLTINSYLEAFRYEDSIIWRAYLNSLFIAIVSTVGTLFTSSLAAYAFAKLKFKGAKPIYGLFIATLMIPGQVTMLPLFMIFASLGWTDTYLPLIVPGVMINTYGVFMLKQFIVSVPNELLEAAEMDGCGYFGKYFKVIIPLIIPALVTLGLFTFIGSWNNYMGHLIYINSEDLTTIPLWIAGLKETHMNGQVWGRIMAATTLSIVPIAIIYLKCQKYFVQGIATTGIK